MGASHQIASSLDGKKHVVWNRGGMWLLEEGNLEEARKISSATHNNKSRRQLEIELTKLMQAEGIDTEWEMIEWNYNPRFSPDGTKIVYSTNRDFDAHNSTSLWIYDLKTNTEKRLFYKDGYHYGALTWLNDGQLLVGESGPILPTETGYYSETAYYLVDVHGNKRELIVPEGIGFQAILPSGVVAYVSYNFEMEGAHLMAVATAIGIGTIDPKTLTIVPKGVERALPAEAAPATFKKVSLNPSGTKLAYSYSETRGSRYGYNILKMVDIIRNKDLEIDLEHAGIDPWELHGHTLRWLSDDQILIHTGRGGRYFDASVNMYVQTLVFSTWLYKLGQ
jgi:dipeptidyl aminopeptidase/acylaminoacyl peptidase